MTPMTEYPEIVLQRAVTYTLANPATIWHSADGIPFQVLSPGFIAYHGGPDFRSIALLIQGDILIGNAEFHRKSSEWFFHKHDDNPQFDSIILHIVIENDKPVTTIPHTLILDETLLRKYLRVEPNEHDLSTADAMGEIQHFALLRLMRKAAEITESIKNYGIETGIRKAVELFLHSFEKKRRRPCYTVEQIEKIGQDFVLNSSLQYIIQYEQNNESIIDIFRTFLTHKFSIEGQHLRREIFLNCLFPIAVALSPKNRRMEAFTWFWSMTSLQTYGILTRQFPHISQEYLWQQQGMLEYRRMNGQRGNISAEALQVYGFEKLFDFFKDAGTVLHDSPLEKNADYDIAEDIIDIE